MAVGSNKPMSKNDIKSDILKIYQSLLIIYSFVIKKSVGVSINIWNASSILLTIGNPCTLKDVLSSAPLPVNSEKCSINEYTKGLSSLINTCALQV